MKLTGSKSKFRAMANSAPILIWTAGPDKLCDWFSQAWLALRGKSLNDELKEGWAVGVHPDDYQRSVQNYNEAFDYKKVLKWNTNRNVMTGITAEFLRGELREFQNRESFLDTSDPVLIFMDVLNSQEIISKLLRIQKQP